MWSYEIIKSLNFPGPFKDPLFRFTLDENPNWMTDILIQIAMESLGLTLTIFLWKKNTAQTINQKVLLFLVIRRLHILVYQSVGFDQLNSMKQLLKISCFH